MVAFLCLQLNSRLRGNGSLRHDYTDVFELHVHATVGKQEAISDLIKWVDGCPSPQ